MYLMGLLSAQGLLDSLEAQGKRFGIRFCRGLGFLAGAFDAQQRLVQLFLELQIGAQGLLSLTVCFQFRRDVSRVVFFRRRRGKQQAEKGNAGERGYKGKSHESASHSSETVTG